MAYYELAFKLRHECPYSRFSTAHPATVISHWCNWSRDVLEIVTPEAKEPRLPRSIRRLLESLGSKPIRTSQAGANLRVVLQHCACDRLPPPTLPTIEARNCLNLQPMVYRSGWEWYRVVAFSELDIRRLFRDLGKQNEVELISRRAVPEGAIHDSLMVSSASLLAGLTDRQARALVLALDQGYYSLPRSATSVEIARRLGVPRTSFVDHLRKAENKVLHSVGPYLRMRASPDVDN